MRPFRVWNSILCPRLMLYRFHFVIFLMPVTFMFLFLKTAYAPHFFFFLPLPFAFCFLVKCIFLFVSVCLLQAISYGFLNSFPCLIPLVFFLLFLIPLRFPFDWSFRPPFLPPRCSLPSVCLVVARPSVCLSRFLSSLLLLFGNYLAITRLFFWPLSDQSSPPLDCYSATFRLLFGQSPLFGHHLAAIRPITTVWPIATIRTPLGRYSTVVRLM